jgi:hypothetical protein
MFAANDILEAAATSVPCSLVTGSTKTVTATLIDSTNDERCAAQRFLFWRGVYAGMFCLALLRNLRAAR